MLVVLPFHSGDKAQAVSLANWIKEMAWDLETMMNDKCLIALGAGVGETGVIEPLRDCFGSVSVFHAESKATPHGEGPMGYMRASNPMWQAVAWKIYFQDKCPWLWLEPDAIPTRPTWLREIKDEYYRCKKPFMGFKSVAKEPGKPDKFWINGVAVYPASVCDYAPLALQAGECAWDVNSGSQTVKHAHVSSLFQHVYQIEGQAPTFPKDKDKLNNAALFHRCKDGTLIAFLKEHGYTTSSGYKHEGEQLQNAGASRGVGTTGGATAVKVDDSDEIGESVDYAQRLEDEQRRHPVRPEKPKEGERFGELVWRGGKWHTATDVVEAPKADRRSVMEKYKNPQKEDFPAPVLAEPRVDVRAVSGNRAQEGEARESTRGDRSASSDESLAIDGHSRGGENSSRDDLVKEAVAVLKQLCTSPYATGQVRKELKKQKVTK